MIRRWWVRLLLGLPLLLAVMLGLTVRTQTGLESLLVLAQRLLPGTLTWERVEGRLLGPLAVEKLRYQDGKFRLNWQRLALDWRPAALFSGRLEVGPLQLRGLDLQLPPAEAKPQTPPVSLEQTLRDLVLPLPFAFTGVAIENATIRPAGAAAPVVIDRLTGALVVREQALQIERLQVQAPQGEVNLNGWLGLQDDRRVNLQLEAQWLQPAPGWRLQGTVTGDLAEQAVIDLTTAGPADAHLTGTVNAVLHRPAADLVLDLKRLDLGVLEPALAGRNLSGRLQAQGGPDAYRASGQWHTTLPEVDAVGLEWRLRGDTKAVQVEELRLWLPERSPVVTLQGRVGLEDLRLDLQGDWHDLVWPLTGKSDIAGPTGTFTIQGTPRNYRAELQAALTGAVFGRLQVRTAVVGTDKRVTVEQLAVDAGAGRTLTAQGEVQLDTTAFQAEGRWQDLAWPLIGDPQVQSPAGSFKAKGTPRNYRAELQAGVTGAEFGRVQVRTEVTGTDVLLAVKQLAVDAGAGRTFTARGEVKLDTAAFQVEGRWQDLAWPLVGAPQMQSPRGTVTARGTAQDYRIELETRMQGPALPEGDWRLTGQGSDKGLPRFELRGLTLGGELRAEGAAAWQPQVDWRVELSGSGLNPGRRWPEWPGRLQFRLGSRGTLVNGRPQLDVTLADLSGTLREQPVQGQGQFALAGEALRISALQAGIGNARLQASGRMEQDWDLRFQVQAPDLARVAPGLAGAVKAEGTVMGPREQPRIAAQWNVAGLKAADTAVQRLTGDVDVDLGGAGRSRLQIRGEGLQAAGQAWRSLNVDATGTAADHGLQARLQGPADLTLELQGAWDAARSNWQGRLTQLTVVEPRLGEAKLDQPWPLQIGMNAALAGPGCLISDDARLCLQGRWDTKTGGEGRLQLSGFRPARLAPLLPAEIRRNVQLEARLSGELSGTRRPDGRLQGRGRFDLSNGRVVVKHNGKPFTIELKNGSVQAQLTGNEAEAQLNLDLGTLGRIEGNARADNMAGQPRLNTRVQAEVRQLDWVGGFVPQARNVTGRINADLTAAGTLPRLTLDGRVRLENAGVEVPAMAVRIQDINLTAESAGDGVLAITGRARSGSGRLRLNGRWQPAAGDLQLNLSGREFLVADAPELRVLVSPDLNLSAAAGAMRVEGKLGVPEARVGGQPGGAGDLPRVRTSGDVVLVNGAEGTAIPTESLPLSLRVQVVLGDEVWVEAADFRGRVTGNVVIAQEPSGPLLGSGSVEIASGTYFVHGQRLQIERGRVFYGNTPLENPALDLRLVRVVDDPGATSPEQRRVTVGVQVTGTLREPRLRLFSEPPMPDGNILSFLAFGRPLQGRGTQFTIGRYLTPALYVGYGIGLFGSMSTFILRYELTRRIVLQMTSAGGTTGGDVFYTIELR